MNEKIIINKLMSLANKAKNINEFPVGALIMKDNKIISTGYNKREKTNITYNHAEIIAIMKANKKVKSWRLNDCSLFVTLEPCDMCKSIIAESRINKVYYLVPRNLAKKQYSKSKFKLLNLAKNDENIIDYKNKMESFFLDKR